jgi:hypothetical protein
MNASITTILIAEVQVTRLTILGSLMLILESTDLTILVGVQGQRIEVLMHAITAGIFMFHRFSRRFGHAE